MEVASVTFEYLTILCQNAQSKSPCVLREPGHIKLISGEFSMPAKTNCTLVVCPIIFLEAEFDLFGFHMQQRRRSIFLSSNLEKPSKISICGVRFRSSIKIIPSPPKPSIFFWSFGTTKQQQLFTIFSAKRGQQLSLVCCTLQKGEENVGLSRTVALSIKNK